MSLNKIYNKDFCIFFLQLNFKLCLLGWTTWLNAVFVITNNRCPTYSQKEKTRQNTNENKHVRQSKTADGVYKTLTTNITKTTRLQTFLFPDNLQWKVMLLLLPRWKQSTRVINCFAGTAKKKKLYLNSPARRFTDILATISKQHFA